MCLIKNLRKINDFGEKPKETQCFVLNTEGKSMILALGLCGVPWGAPWRPHWGPGGPSGSKTICTNSRSTATQLYLYFIRGDVALWGGGGGGAPLSIGGCGGSPGEKLQLLSNSQSSSGSHWGTIPRSGFGDVVLGDGCVARRIR